jgi:hypothetical protein
MWLHGGRAPFDPVDPPVAPNQATEPPVDPLLAAFPMEDADNSDESAETARLYREFTESYFLSNLAPPEVHTPPEIRVLFPHLWGVWHYPDGHEFGMADYFSMTEEPAPTPAQELSAMAAEDGDIEGPFLVPEGHDFEFLPGWAPDTPEGYAHDTDVESEPKQKQPPPSDSD